jgi:hypothetical protein
MEEDWLEKFKKDGYCVVPSVLNEEEVKKAVDGMWEWLEALGTGIKRDNPQTWNHKQWPPISSGIIQDLPVGQEQFVWDIRLASAIFHLLNMKQTTSESC